MEDIDQPAMLAEIRAAGFEEALLFSTCDRLEVVALHREPEAALGPLSEDVRRARTGRSR